MSCRHDLALETCARCYPTTGTMEPGPEEEYEENLEGPGAVNSSDYRPDREKNPAMKNPDPLIGLTVTCKHPNCTTSVSNWYQCPTCLFDLGLCEAHGGRAQAEEMMRRHILRHTQTPT